ncbi:hypothetical protein PG637_01995 [Riemerella anatipestifer]|nr:hypothetical protein [Riemerella anatipestifer]MDY3324441.1 hypothetical protein [Riemerella anatipestifer]MDY3353256.1 hypothetical protein [Riemerella anatipestifer]
MNETKIKKRHQDRNSEAWKKLCAYIEKVEKENAEEFSPYEELGPELFSQIYTLPESIGKLKNVKKMWLYGSKLQSIPPQIGEMTSLEYFDPYTSYDLHWFPYEITKCVHLKDSRVSTRALYGNYKNRKTFPDLSNNPVRYNSETVKCSVCEKEMTYEQTNQKWITLRVGTDDLPLLTNLCSTECENKLPKPKKGYVDKPHKGGVDLKQPTYEEWEKENVVKMTVAEWEEELKMQNKNNEKEPIKLLKLIRKIWEK